MADKFDPSWAIGDKNTWDALVRSMMAGGIGLVDASGGKTAISSDFVSGGSSLPEVSADDNGDVLTVVEGEWAKAAPSGGGSVASVRITFSGFDGTALFSTCYGEYIPSREIYSMVSPALEYTITGDQNVSFQPMCIPGESSEYKALIVFNDLTYNDATFEVSGNIAQTAVDVQIPSSPTTWYSEILHGFIVSGDGAINVIAG